MPLADVMRTHQKTAAADQRLEEAARLLREAEARSRAAQRRSRRRNPHNRPCRRNPPPTSPKTSPRRSSRATRRRRKNCCARHWIPGHRPRRRQRCLPWTFLAEGGSENRAQRCIEGIPARLLPAGRRPRTGNAVGHADQLVGSSAARPWYPVDSQATGRALYEKFGWSTTPMERPAPSVPSTTRADKLKAKQDPRPRAGPQHRGVATGKREHPRDHLGGDRPDAPRARSALNEPHFKEQ